MADEQKYSAEWIRKRVTERDAVFLENHKCSLCARPVGYIFVDREVFYASRCGCSWSPDRPSSFDAIAQWLGMQSSDEMRDRIMERLG